MADHPETTALRLAEAAPASPLRVVGLHHPEVGGGFVRMQSSDGSLHVDITAWKRPEHRDALAAHIAHAHPGRVRAWLGAVARLRERAAEGHASDCVRRLGDDATVYRSSDDGDTHHRVRVGDLPCTCGHDLDLAALAAVDAEG